MRTRRKRYNNRRRYKSKYIKASTTTRVRGVGFPDKMYTKLKYVENIHSTAVGGLENIVYRGNSVYDPQYSAGGHQPLFFDQYIAVYEKYRVIGSSVRLQITNESTQALNVAILPTSTPISLTTFQAVLEQNRSSAIRTVPPSQYLISTQKRYCSTRQATGATKSELYDQDYAGTFNSDPVNLWYWNFYLNSVDNVTAIDARILLTITYYVEFFDRQNVAQS